MYSSERGNELCVETIPEDRKFGFIDLFLIHNRVVTFLGELKPLYVPTLHARPSRQKQHGINVPVWCHKLPSVWETDGVVLTSPPPRPFSHPQSVRRSPGELEAR